MKTKQLLLLCLAVLTCTLNVSAIDYYVKTTGLPTNNGLTWETPVTLDAALALADEATDDVIHIAAGTYAPTTLIASSDGGLTDRDKTFEIYKNISLIGGYPTDATAGALPAPKINETILSGDLGGGVNAYHVMVITAPQFEGQQVSIAGLTIKDGNADGTGTVTTTNNGAKPSRTRAGGIYPVDAIVELTDCNIVDNLATSGPAITTLMAANVTLRRCNVERNNSTANGGGIFVEGPKEGADAFFALYDCNISNNDGGSTASGLYTINFCTVLIFNSTISNNSCGRSGAGIYVREGTRGYIVNSTIQGNRANTLATTGTCRAGLVIYGVEKTPTSFDAINTTITANDGNTGTGGLEVVQYAHSNIYNCLISGNYNEAKEYTIGSKGATSTIQNSIVADVIYDNAGIAISDVSFDKSTIGGLVLNKPEHHTKTCLISEVSGSVNPALVGYGMTSLALEALATTYTPAIPTELLNSDQVGVSREGLTAMGAFINPVLTSTSNVKSNSFYVVSQIGQLTIVPSTIDRVSIYSISGVKVFDKLIADNVNVALSPGIYLVQMGNEVTRALVR